MSEFNHSRPKKKYYKEYSHDRVDNPIDHTEKPLNRIIERSKEKSVEQHLHEILGVNEKQPDHEKVLNKLIQGLVEQKTPKEKRIQEKFVVEQRLHEILGVNEKQPDHEKVLNKLLNGLTEKKILKEKRIHEKSVEKNVHEVLGVNEKQPDHEKILNSNQEEMNTIYLKTSKLPENGEISFALLKTNEIGLEKKKKEKNSENKVNNPILTEHELRKDGYNDLSEDFGIDEDYDDLHDDIDIPKIRQYLSIPEKMRELISCNPEETKPFQDYLNYLYFVEDHPDIQKLMKEYKEENKSNNFRNFRYSDDIFNFFKRKMAEKDLNKWMGNPVDTSKIEEMKKTVQLIKKFNPKPNLENTETEPWKLIKWVVEHEPCQFSVSKISKIVPIQKSAVRSHLRLMFKDKYYNYILDGASEGNIRHRLINNPIYKHIKKDSRYTGYIIEPTMPFPDYKYRLDFLTELNYGEKYFLYDTTHNMRINSIVKKLIVYPPGDKAELLVVITNPDLTQDYKNILIDQIMHFNEKMKIKEGLKRDFIPKTTLKRIKLLNWKEFAHYLGIKENSEEWKELGKICTANRKELLEMEKNADNQEVNGNQDFEEFLKTRKISDIFGRPDPHIRDNINYLTDLKQHYPIVLNFIQFAQNLYKDDPDPSVNYGQINSFLKTINEIISPLDPYWPRYDTTKILNGLYENDSISKIGNNYKITESLSNDHNANVNKILLDEKIRDIFRIKNPHTFKEMHGIIDSHVNQYYEFKEKWQPIDSYKILNYYEKNMNGFSVKKKLNDQKYVNVNKRKLFVGIYFPVGDGNVLIKIDKNFVYCYPSINLKAGIQLAPVIYDRNTWDRIQFYKLLGCKGESGILYHEKNEFGVGIYFPKQSGEKIIIRIDKKEEKVKIYPDLGAKEQPVIYKQTTTLNYKKIQSYVLIDKYGAHRTSTAKRYLLEKIYKNKIMALDNSNPDLITFYPEKDIDKPGIVFNKTTGKKIQYYQDLEENGGFVYDDKTYTFPDHGGKKVLIKIDENEKKILCFPGHNLEGKPLVKPINESNIFQFFKEIGKSNQFGYLGKLYGLRHDFPSKKVAVTVKESENRMYIYPDQDFNKPPQILDLMTGKLIQFYKKIKGKNRICYQSKNFFIGPVFPSEKMVVTVNESENRIYMYPDQDLNKQPVIFDILTGERIQFYKKLQKGHFKMNDVSFNVSEECKMKLSTIRDMKDKLAVVKVDHEKNEVIVTLDKNVAKNPFVFNKTTGKLILSIKS